MNMQRITLIWNFNNLGDKMNNLYCFENEKMIIKYEELCDQNRVKEMSKEFEKEAECLLIGLYKAIIDTLSMSGTVVMYDGVCQFETIEEFDKWLDDDSYLKGFKMLCKKRRESKK